MAPALAAAAAIGPIIEAAKVAAAKLDTTICAFILGEDFRIHGPNSGVKGIPINVTPKGILVVGGVAITLYALYTLIKWANAQGTKADFGGPLSDIPMWPFNPFGLINGVTNLMRQ